MGVASANLSAASTATHLPLRLPPKCSVQGVNLSVCSSSSLFLLLFLFSPCSSSPLLPLCFCSSLTWFSLSSPCPHSLAPSSPPPFSPHPSSFLLPLFPMPLLHWLSPFSSVFPLIAPTVDCSEASGSHQRGRRLSDSLHPQIHEVGRLRLQW